ncbi:MAG: RagB/SusD family nutrient uptake outer membrane protein [Tannerellaceae bacterium]|jgi:hypothetical protein|nr:RagB/SusD family nutrient uptake outer membrane protein [Tannerellaceae bacterium]
MRITFLAGFISAAILLSSCLDDLNTLPLNKTDYTSEKAYGNEEVNYLAGLAKIYASFTNQYDLQVDDYGASEINRAFWALQELSTDAAKCAWENDSWVKDVNQNSWSGADNAATYAVYARTLHGITYVNEFLRQTTDERLSDRGVSGELQAKIHSMRAEARFVRAYLYWISMDIFGNVPFVTEESEFGAVSPPQVSRVEVFDYIVSELNELSASEAMPAPRSNYPRADKGSVLGLLARVYLNAEVYSGTPQWQEAKEICEKIWAMNYTLCPDYAALFRGDNGENPDALNEILFAIAYDAASTQSWGGTTFLSVGATQVDDDPANTLMVGVNDHWSGIRVPYEYAANYFDVSAADYTTGTYAVSDKRGELFFIRGRSEEMSDIAIFSQGWGLFKFNNVPHDQTAAEYYPVAQTLSFANIDMPLIRLGEICLIYAEACLYQNATAQALPYLNQLRRRAGAKEITSYDADWLLAERARELMWESHRRTDLIRHGKFHSGTFLWKYKGEAYDGQGFEAYMNLFAIPASELASNTNLVQNPGYIN